MFYLDKNLEIDPLKNGRIIATAFTGRKKQHFIPKTMHFIVFWPVLDSVLYNKSENEKKIGRDR